MLCARSVKAAGLQETAGFVEQEKQYVAMRWLEWLTFAVVMELWGDHAVWTAVLDKSRLSGLVPTHVKQLSA